MTRTPPQPLPLGQAEIFPADVCPLEEVAAAAPADLAAALGFALDRLAVDDGRPLAFVAPAAWRRERGRPFARGLVQAGGAAASRLIWIAADKEAQALWALEEALKSGAVAGAIGAALAPSFVATRRIDFAARAGGARAVLLRAQPGGDLSAARRRWRIASLPSAAHPFDPQAPGAPRLTAELTRRRDGPPGAWTLEKDDETGRFRVAAGLAGDGVPARRTRRRAA